MNNKLILWIKMDSSLWKMVQKAVITNLILKKELKRLKLKKKKLLLKRKKNKRKIVKNEYKGIIKLNLYHQNRMNY